MSEKPKSFSIPLIGPKKNFAAPNGVWDLAEVGKRRRELFGDNIFGVKPDEPVQEELPLECG